MKTVLKCILCFSLTLYAISIYSQNYAGNKLRKILDEPAHDNKPARHIETDYLNGFVYQNNELQFFLHEEGRIRKTENGAFVYDHFIKDHLSNTRMVLTEEQQQDIYPIASLEDAKVAIERDYYTIQPNDPNVVNRSEATGIPNYANNNGIGNNPPDVGFEAANSQKLYKLNSNGAKTGLGIALKVMAGDKINVFGKSYYFQNTSGSNSPIPVIDLLSGFLNTPAGMGSAHGLTPGALNVPSGIGAILSLITQQNNQSNAAPAKPRAFINVIFFDEQFRSYDYRLSMVGNAGQVKDHFADLQNIVAGKSGYVYIYCSNVSPVNVFFDNLQIVHRRSPILEENHYYSYGLKIAAISSKAAGALQNSYLYQGDFSEFDEDAGYNEFYLRHYDAQIGRWTTTDPYEQFANPYLGMGNNPGGMVDPDGGASIFRQFLNLPRQEWLSFGNILSSASLVQAGLSLVNNVKRITRTNKPPDWYIDNYGIMQFDPNVKGQGDLSLSFRSGRYVGKTYSEVTSRGDKIDYRIDGSILYANENDAYQRMKVIGATREAFAVDLGSQILYLPDYKNLYNESFHEDYGYIFNGNKIYDPVIGQQRKIFFTAHTHLSLYKGKPWGADSPSDDDVYFFSRKTTNVPFITIGDKSIFGYYGSWQERNDGRYYFEDVKRAPLFEISRADWFMGMRRIIKHRRSLYGNF